MWNSLAIANATTDMQWQHVRGEDGVVNTRVALAAMGRGRGVHLNGRWRWQQQGGTFQEA
jgi:hypothetical protein